MGGESFDYKFGNKNNWRRWSWNRVRALIEHPSKEIVIYLAGAGDLDREVAIQKGFRGNNLIAVENDEAVLKTLRDKKVLTISGDLLDVLEAWPTASERSVGVIFADMMHGLEKDFCARFSQLFLHPAFKKTVVVCNLMRGRDQSSKRLRDYMVASIRRNPSRLNGLSQLHRGVAFHSAVISGFYYKMVGLEVEKRPEQYVQEWEIREWIESGLAHSLAAFSSYRSTTGQIFDSVVFRSPWYFLSEIMPGNVKGPEVFTEWSILNAPDVKYKKRLMAQKLKNSAILAHRTMRLQAS